MNFDWITYNEHNKGISLLLLIRELILIYDNNEFYFNLNILTEK